MPSSSSTCLARASAPSWLVWVALGAMLVLVSVLAYQYLIKPAMTIHGLRREMKKKEGFEAQEEDDDPGANTTNKAIKARFVFLHMEGCGWCERFKPTWDELVAKDADALRTKGLVLEDHESNSSESKQYAGSVQGYPTLLLVPADGSADVQPVKFEGERTRADILDFLAVNGYAAQAAASLTEQYADVQRLTSGAGDIMDENVKTVKASQQEGGALSSGTQAKMKNGGGKLTKNDPYA